MRVIQLFYVVNYNRLLVTFIQTCFFFFLMGCLSFFFFFFSLFIICHLDSGNKNYDFLYGFRTFVSALYTPITNT